jgi:hypothetical protein
MTLPVPAGIQGRAAGSTLPPPAAVGTKLATRRRGAPAGGGALPPAAAADGDGPDSEARREMAPPPTAPPPPTLPSESPATLRRHRRHRRCSSLRHLHRRHRRAPAAGRPPAFVICSILIACRRCSPAPSPEARRSGGPAWGRSGRRRLCCRSGGRARLSAHRSGLAESRQRTHSPHGRARLFAHPDVRALPHRRSICARAQAHARVHSRVHVPLLPPGPPHPLISFNSTARSGPADRHR